MKSVWIINKQSSFDLSVCEDVEPMNVLVSELSNIYCLSILPIIHWRTTSFLFFPISVDNMSFVTVRLFSNSDFLFKDTVILTFWVLVVVNTCHSMRMTIWNQSVHSLFLEPIHRLKRLRFISHCQRVCWFEFDRITLKPKFVIWTTS